MLANMFLGWGLDFVVVVDDDTLGRSIYKQLKLELCADSEEMAAHRLWKIRDCWGIEDVFSTHDFKRYILRDEQAHVSGKNTEFLKTAKRSKPVMAYQFWQDVQASVLDGTKLEAATLSKIEEVVGEICKRLETH
jgi:hypothetical protein